MTPAIVAQSIARCVQLARHRRLALLTDLDGTIIPFAATTEAAELPEAPARLLRTLLELGVCVVGVSGRPRPLVERLMPRVPGAWWAAEHGAWRCRGWQDAWVCSVERHADLDVLEAELTGIAVRFPGARIESKTASVCVHWRHVDPVVKPALQEHVEEALLDWLSSRPDHERLPGVEMVEVRPRAMHKGAAVRWVRGMVDDLRVIAIGDDATDEHMFAALGSEDVAIKVGGAVGASLASTYVDDVPSTWRLLRWLVEARRAAGTIAAPPVRHAASREER